MVNAPAENIIMLKRPACNIWFTLHAEWQPVAWKKYLLFMCNAMSQFNEGAKGKSNSTFSSGN